MELSLGTETLGEYYALEVAAAARKLLAEVMLIRPGEAVVISADTQSDMRVVQATAEAAYTLGAQPVVLWYETRPQAQMEPFAPVAAAVAAADVWVEYAVAYTLYTDARRRASEKGCRYACMSGMDVDTLVRTIGKVNYPKMLELGQRLCELTQAAREVRVTTELGTDLVASNEGAEVRQSGGLGDSKGALVMLGGQVGWLPLEESVSGRIVIDGTIWPPAEIGVPGSPVELRLEKGRIVEISGGREALFYQAWMRGLGDENMYRLAHYTYGFNPGVSRLTGRIVEDERYFGCMVFGFGGTHNRPAVTHTDAVLMGPTVVLDGVEVERDGHYVHSQLATICKEIGVSGY